MRIETSIQIKASKKEVWDVLMDFNEYAYWNPFIKSITGIGSIGMPLEITLPTMKFKPIVHTKKNEELFSWQGKLWVKGIFDGHHQFKLIAIDDHNCLFKHREDFSGILVPLLKKKLNADTRLGFEAMNIALKNRVESMTKK
ncbi:SRPBCC domain-containing protein [Myroides sp. N17-2]|uniref:SRPBCC domain-containing protein n=1 Tax=Myroides sp. N17-2 TaxID=2030799 RepID=UPI000EFB5C14|nr:SRPBCC domain-containing protein [Myroides sp. N17-2]